MVKNNVLAFCVCLFSFVAVAQSSNPMEVLQQIEQNNATLKAFSSFLESKKLSQKASNNLPDPQAGVYYLPFGNHASGDYTEFQVTQSFEFPSVYSVRGDLIEMQEAQNTMEYQLKRQEVLLPAFKLLNELIFLAKKEKIEQLRVLQSKKIFDQTNELFELEQAGILELNKAKIAWIQEQFKLDILESDRKKIMIRLKNMNGGIELDFAPNDYIGSLAINDPETLWQEKMQVDPEFKILLEQEKVAQQQIRLSKNKSLPNLTAGYNYQGVSGSIYSGVYGGVSIPLWSTRNTVKAAEANYDYQKSFTQVKTDLLRTEFLGEYEVYQVLLKKYQEYQSTLESLGSEELLLQAFELGELSFMQYYIELQFYQNALDSMLVMENQLVQSKAELLKHQL
ncbi:TolC family protein [Algoriphagus sp. AGSA1]|uniref:TolC family protein n=1 Tax=unclassified Algoriphagus TaxID=2641541 RepID=UPI0017800D12|nr:MULTISPECIES: TolC family protein [unclassified Algoriphagus]MCE7056239.1 TolC family protein [Algoriphagus sp. AGSA1]